MRRFDKIRVLVRDVIPDIPVISNILSTQLAKRIESTLISGEEVRIGEFDVGKKREIVRKYQKKKGRVFENIDQQIESVISTGNGYKELNKEEANEIRTDMRFCYIAYGFLPGEYGAFGLESKGYEERKSFISDKERRMYRCKVNDILAANMFLDKGRTYDNYKEYYHRIVISISNPFHYKRFASFIDSHSEFVLKNAIDSLGKSVWLIKSLDIVDKKKFFYHYIKKGKFILEERIIQSKYMAVLNESSVNTVRPISYSTKNGIVVPYCILRVGRKGSFVDNGGSGGIIACIDFDSGVVITDGYDESGNIFEAHPDSGTVFKGYKLPEHESLKAICIECAAKSKKIKLIGWDFAHTKDGWIIVEGNENPHIIGQQMIMGGMKEVIESVIKEMDT